MSTKGDYNFEAPQFIGCLLSPNDLNDGADNFFDAENSDKAKVSQPVVEENHNVSTESKDSGTSVSCDTGSTTSVETVTEAVNDESGSLRSGKKLGRNSVAPLKTIKNTSPKKMFLSLAEQVHRFHHGTPPRFKNKSGPYKSRGNKMLPTIGQSPLLHTKTRSRPSTVPTIVSEERPFLKPVKRATSPKPPPRPASKPTTVPQPFNLTATNKYKKPTDLKDTEKNAKENMNAATRTPLKPANVKKKIIQVEDGKVVMKEDWAISGLKTIDKVNKTTKCVPFSFEERNQNFLKTKQRKIEEAREKTIEDAKTLAQKSFRPSLAVVNKK